MYFCTIINNVITIFIHIMKIENRINESVKAAINALYGQDVPETMIQLQKTRYFSHNHT